MRVNIDTVKVRKKINNLKIKKWWLAERLNITYRTLARWLNGEIKTIEMSSAVKLCDILECKLDDISLNKKLTEIDSFRDPQASSKLVRDLHDEHFDEIASAIHHSKFTRNTLHTLLTDNIRTDDLAAVLSNLCKIAFRRDEMLSSIKFANKLIYYDTQKRNYARLAETYAYAANAYGAISKIDKCVSYFDKVRDLRDVVDVEIYARIKLLHANACFNHQRTDLVVNSINEETLNVFKTKNMTLNQIKAYHLLALTAQAENRLEDAREFFIKATDLSQHFSLTYLYYIKLYHMGCEVDLGNLVEAYKIEASLNEFPKQYKVVGQYATHYYFAKRRILSGEYDEARKLLVKSEKNALKVFGKSSPFFHTLYSKFLELAKIRNSSEDIKHYNGKLCEYETKCNTIGADQFQPI